MLTFLRCRLNFTVLLLELSGKIFVSRPLDIETQENFTLVINATDRGEMPLTTAVVVTVQLTDVNDEYPMYD